MDRSSKKSIKDSKKKDTDRKKSPSSKSKSDELTKASSKKNANSLKTKDKKDSIRSKQNKLKESQKKSAKNKDLSISLIKKKEKNKAIASTSSKEKAKSPKISLKRLKKMSQYSDSDDNYSDDYSDDYYSSDQITYSESDQKEKSESEYSENENEDIQTEEDEIEETPYNENAPNDLLRDLNSNSPFDRKIKFHQMPPFVPLIPTLGSFQDNLSDEIGGQFDFLSGNMNSSMKSNKEDSGFKLDASSLKNMYITSESKDMIDAFHIDIVNENENQTAKDENENVSPSCFTKNDEFLDDISELPEPMQISLKSMKSCFDQLTDVLAGVSCTTRGLFKGSGFENENFENEFRSIEKEKNSLIISRRFNQFTQSDFMGQASSIIKI